MKTDISADINLKCSVATAFSASSGYEVTWKFQPQEENKVIVNSNKDGIVTFGNEVDEKLRQRITTRRFKGPSFELTIHQAEVSDEGSYICEVVEWLQAPDGLWLQLSTANTTTVVTVIEPGKFA